MQVDAKPTSRLSTIEDSIVSDIMSGRMKSGDRLGESILAAEFSVSRTLVREALMRLAARRIVRVSPRRGWYVLRPSRAEAHMVYATRRALESGYLRLLPPPGAAALRALSEHLEAERACIGCGQQGRLTCLMADFHMKLAELTGNAVIIDEIRDLTARTILISMHNKDDEGAMQAHLGHRRIFAAVERGDMEGAARAAVRHLDEVEDLLRQQEARADEDAGAARVETEFRGPAAIADPPGEATKINISTERI